MKVAKSHLVRLSGVIKVYDKRMICSRSDIKNCLQKNLTKFFVANLATL